MSKIIALSHSSFSWWLAYRGSDLFKKVMLYPSHLSWQTDQQKGLNSTQKNCHCFKITHRTASDSLLTNQSIRVFFIIHIFVFKIPWKEGQSILLWKFCLLRLTSLINAFCILMHLKRHVHRSLSHTDLQRSSHDGWSRNILKREVWVQPVRFSIIILKSFR